MPTSTTIKDMQAHAKSRGGKCLSKKFVNYHIKLQWECDKGHQWWATPATIKYTNSWCGECSGTIKKLTIEQMRDMAKAKGGECLSSEYINAGTHLQWQCDKGHKWFAVPSSIKTGTWCPECRKLTIGQMQDMAKAKGGKCLSEEYINAKTNLQWECSKGHKWWATSSVIKSAGSWCPVCADTTLTIKDMQTIAKSHGGKCLSKEYINSVEKLQWECDKGHKWWAIPATIKYQGSWCPKCVGRQKLTIKEMQELAKAKGGKCLSANYKNYNTKLQWECAKGHKWWTTPNVIKHTGCWCPECYREDMMKKAIEEMHVLVKSKGGKCLSSKYISGAKLKFECAKGHTWIARAASVRNSNSWCPKCIGRMKTIEDMHALAKEKGGKCLSTEYINCKTKLKWGCDQGHTWEALYSNIEQNLTFCQYCKREEQLEIKMRKLRQKKARSFKMRGGQIDG